LSNGDKAAPQTSAAIGIEDVGAKTVVTTAAISHITQVYCYDETLRHISEEHLEFREFIPSLEHAVHDAITNPTHVVESNPTIHAGGFKYCSERHTSGGSKHLVVAVKAVEGTSALLKTAYFTDSVTATVILDQRNG
jgi:hypothetical protein